VFVRRPQEQAVCAFLLRAISRSGRHSMLMSIYVGAGLAMMITFVLPDALRQGASAFEEPTLATLALPLVLSVAIACGARILMTVPAEMNARWIFQTASISPREVDAAAHKGLLLLVVPIVMVTAFATAAPLWGVRVGGLHAVFCGSLALLLCEVLLIGYRGIPLTRPYVPGASRFHLLWPVYLSLFLTYTLSSAEVERKLLKWTDPQGIFSVAAIFCAIALGFWTVRKVKVHQATEVPFEADMPEDQMFQGFNLSEIQAAQAVASHPASVKLTVVSKRE
jgi:hypothetical protein